MKIYEEYFKFPIVLYDRRVERHKAENSISGELFDTEIIIGDAEIHISDEVVTIQDAWLPTRESFDIAKGGVFQACEVIFKHGGDYLVPMSREKFKRKHEKFILDFEESVKKEEGDEPVIKPKIIFLSQQQFDNIKNQLKNGTDGTETSNEGTDNSPE